MWWAAVVQGFQAAFGASNAIEAADDARTIAEMNAYAQQAETKEEVRRMRATIDQTVSFANTSANASGFNVGEGTSQRAYIDELAAEGDRQIDFAQKAGYKKANILKRGGQLAFSEGKAAAWSSGASAVGSFIQAGVGLWGEQKNG
jgi:hypothetical protein